MSALHNHGSILDTLGEHPTIAAPRPLFHFFTSLFHCFCDPNHGERTPPPFRCGSHSFQWTNSFLFHASITDRRRVSLVVTRVGPPAKHLGVSPSRVVETLSASLSDVKPAGRQRVVSNLNGSNEGRIRVKEIGVYQLVCNQLEKARLKISRIQLASNSTGGGNKLVRDELQCHEIIAYRGQNQVIQFVGESHSGLPLPLTIRKNPELDCGTGCSRDIKTNIPLLRRKTSQGAASVLVNFDSTDRPIQVPGYYCPGATPESELTARPGDLGFAHSVQFRRRGERGIYPLDGSAEGLCLQLYSARVTRATRVELWAFSLG